MMTYQDAKLFCSSINVTIDGATMHAQMFDFTAVTYRLALKGIEIMNLILKEFTQASYIDRVRFKPLLKTSSKTTSRFYISFPQQSE